MICCFIFGIFNININLVIGFAGAFAGFILVYLTPTFMHRACVLSKAACYKLCKEKDVDYEEIANKLWIDK